MKKVFVLIFAAIGLYSFVSAAVVDDAVSWMYDNGLTIHNNATDFKSTQWLRRDEAAKFYVNFAKQLNKTGYVKTASQCTFSDINDSWSDLKDIVIESCRLGLFQWSKDKFNPKNQLTNAQAITVLVRLLAGNQSEVWLSHRADNYYSKANELGVLQSVSMNSKNNTATRGNVGIVIYNGKNKQTNQNCAKEGEITQRLWDNPKYCCEGLEWYQRPDLPDWVWVELLCYNKTKWEPSCIIDWHRLEWRYYNDWTLLRKDESCKVATTYKIDDTYFNKYKQPIDIMFRNVLIKQNLWYITIPNHDSVKTNPSWVIDIDWWYRFTIPWKDEVCSILKTFDRSDLSCYDAENGASVYIEFKILDNTYTRFRVLHYVWMQETQLHDMKYKIVDLK